MVSTLAPEEGAAASTCPAVSKNADKGDRSTVASPVRQMHPDVAALLLATGTTPRRRPRRRPAPASAAAEVRGRARYDYAFEEEPPADGGFAPPRLVWAKVRGHPWWPGQVFDPADASALALHELRRNRRPDAVVLVACFGDGTFVWADAEDLLPLREGFPSLAEIGGRSFCKSTFTTAVEDALDEVSRRVDAGLSCRCGGASVKKQVIVNSGLRRGARGADAVDAAFARDAFRGEAFVRHVFPDEALEEYASAIAVTPPAGSELRDLAVACTPRQKAFEQWRDASPRGITVYTGTMDDADAEEYASAMAVTPPAGAEPRDLAVATTAQWMGTPGGIIECTVTMDVAANGTMGKCTGTEIVVNGNAEMEAATPPPACRDTPAKKTGSSGGDDAEADPGKCWTVTSCISSGEDSACENDGDDAWETESEDFEPASEWGLGWKDYVIILQLVAIVLLVCELMWQHPEKIEL